MESLTLQVEREIDTDILTGILVSKSGNRYPIKNGVPDLTYPFVLPESDQEMKTIFDDIADVYDEYLPLTFTTFSEDESTVRNDMVDMLNLTPSSTVLETSCGTGRGSEIIAQRLNDTGKLYLQDISPMMLEQSRKRLGNAVVPIEYSVANGYYLPFPDNFFDAAYHFGGLTTFGNVGRTFTEMTRVTKVGGKVVIADESMPPWLRSTKFGKILMNSNPHYQFNLPLEHIPVEARQVRLRWILGGVYFVLDYVVGDGEPDATLDFEIPGPRGGTHMTRYYGQLDGVTEETKKLAMAARLKSDKSLHAWLDQVIRQAAEAELKKN